jgi:CPA2 family monovalent cation:H+ antiporter-2
LAEQLLLSLAFIAAAIIVGSVASIRLKFPPVVMLIIIGILLGPNALGLVENGEGTKLFAEIGGILLLFLIGTEFSFNKIMKLGLNAIIVAFVELTLLFIIVYAVSISMGFQPLASVFIGLAISVTSTALTVKMLQDLSLTHRQETALLVGVSIIEDVVAVFALSILSGLAAGVHLGPEDIILSTVKSITILVVAYFVLSKLLSFLLKTHEIGEDNMVVIALGLAMGLSFLATYVGLSPAIGAFVAGNIIVSIPQAREFTHSVHKFSLFFISLFFLSIGILVNPADIITEFNLVILLLLLAIIGKFVGVGIGTYLAGYPGDSAAFAGIAMIPIGEISILIIKSGVDIGVLPFSFLGATSILVLVTSLLSYPAILYNRKIYGFVDSLVPNAVKEIGREISNNMSHYRYQLSVEGPLFKKLTSARGILIMVVVVPTFFLTVFYLMPFYLGRKTTLTILLLVGAALLLLHILKKRREEKSVFKWKMTKPRKMKYNYSPE